MKGLYRSIAFGISVSFSGLAGLTGVQASVVLDQASPAATPGAPIHVPFGYNFFSPPYSPVSTGFVQSFTAGRTGYLDHLDFELRDAGILGTATFSLYAGDLAAGGATLLLTSALDTSEIADKYSYPFVPTRFDVRSANFLVAAGMRYSVSFSFMPTSGSGQIYLVNGHYGEGPDDFEVYNDYAGGELTFMSSILPGTFGAVSPGDIGFRSYVEELAVPEPASWAMMIAGLGLVGAAMRRRKTVISFA